MFKKMKCIVILCFVLGICIGVNADATDMKKTQEYFNAINYDWWKNFRDPILQNYILVGLINNSDLKIANAKIDEYKQFVKYTFGSELPTVSLDANYASINKMPMVGNTNGFVMPLTASYEIDLFGKNRDKTKATKKQLEAYQLYLQSSYISYVSSLGTLYFNIMKIKEILKLYDELLAIKQEIVEHIYLKEDNGLSTIYDVNTVEKELKTIKNKKTELVKQKSTLMTQFAVLLGQNPADAEKLEINNFNFKDVDIKELMFINSDVIFNRPDVLAVEKELEKAKIDIKVARKEFLPSFNITGVLAFNDIAKGGFFSLANTIKGLVVGCSEPLFVGGKKKANVKMTQSRYEQMLETYRKTTLQATKEINDSLAIFTYDYRINDENQNKLILESSNFSSYKMKYKNGMMSYSDLLKLKQNLIMQKIETITTTIQLNIDYIGLYKSTAGKL